MILWPAIITLAVTALPPPPSPPASVEKQLLNELNLARSDPAAYADRLREYRNYYRDRLIAVPGAPVLYQTEEGVAPVDEAIAFLNGRAGGETLVPAAVLADAADDHRAEQAADGSIGHVGRDGSAPADRVRRRGGGAYVGEVIAYGSDTPTDMVRQLIVDDGVPDRSHRRLLFDRSLRFAGVSCGAHPVYRTVCVIDLARTEDGQATRMSADRQLARISRRDRRDPA